MYFICILYMYVLYKYVCICLYYIHDSWLMINILGLMDSPGAGGMKLWTTGKNGPCLPCPMDPVVPS